MTRMASRPFCTGYFRTLANNHSAFPGLPDGGDWTFSFIMVHWKCRFIGWKKCRVCDVGCVL